MNYMAFKILYNLGILAYKMDNWKGVCHIIKLVKLMDNPVNNMKRKIYKVRHPCLFKFISWFLWFLFNILKKKSCVLLLTKYDSSSNPSSRFCSDCWATMQINSSIKSASILLFFERTLQIIGKKKKKISRILNYSRCDHYHHTTIFLYCKNACTILFLYKQKKFKRKYDMQW